MDGVNQAAVDTAASGTATAAPAADTDGNAGEGRSVLEAFLSNEENKAAYDAAVEGAVAAALEKQKADAEEAKRVAKLSAEEKLAEREKHLDEREAQLQASERKSAAVVELGKVGIPTKLAECLNYSSQEAYEQSFTAAKEAFQEAVEAAVNDRLRGKGQVTVASGPAAAKSVGNPAALPESDFKRILREGHARMGR